MTRPCSHVLLLAFSLLAAPLFAKGGYTVTVANPLDEPRAGEMVEVAAPDGDWLVHDAVGPLLPSQRTHTGTLLFQATVSAKGSAAYANLVGIATAVPDRPFTYYWGADWSKADRVADFAAWQSLAQSTLRRLRAPLVVTVTPE